MLDCHNDVGFFLFKPSARFGSAVAVLDFNKDGVLDLAVGAPSVGSQELSYRVRICVCGIFTV